MLQFEKKIKGLTNLRCGKDSIPLDSKWVPDLKRVPDF